MCADIKGVKSMNSKRSAKEEDESSPRPPDSLDLAPSDFHLAGLLKDPLRGRRFADDELKLSVREQLRRFGEVYATGIQRPT
jgi:hypothetical protein